MNIKTILRAMAWAKKPEQAAGLPSTKTTSPRKSSSPASPLAQDLRGIKGARKGRDKAGSTQGSAPRGATPAFATIKAGPAAAARAGNSRVPSQDTRASAARPSPPPTAAQTAAAAYKGASPTRAEIYSEQQAVVSQKKSKLARKLSAFAKVRQFVSPAPKVRIDTSMGVFGGTRGVNRDTRQAAKAERPLRVRGTTYDVGGVATTEHQHGTGQAAKFPAKIPAMDFASIQQEMKIHPQGDESLPARNRFPEPDPAADTRRLKNALLTPPAELDKLGADAPTLDTVQAWVPLSAPATHPELMRKVNENRRKKATAAVGKTGQPQATETLQSQQDRLMTELRAKESVRVKNISRQRAMAYIGKAERNLLDTEETLATIEYLRDPKSRKMVELREALALRSIFNPNTLPDIGLLREHGLETVASLAQCVMDAQATRAQIRQASRNPLSSSASEIERLEARLNAQQQAIDVPAAQLDPVDVRRYVNLYIDQLFDDLYALRDLPADTTQALNAGTSEEARARVLGPEVDALLQQLGSPEEDQALQQLANWFRSADLEQRFGQSLQWAEELGGKVAQSEMELDWIERFLAAQQRTAVAQPDAEPDAAHQTWMQELQSEISTHTNELADLKQQQAAAAAEAAVLRRACSLGPRLGLKDAIENAADSYFTAVARKDETAETVRRTEKLYTTTQQAAQDIRTDIAQMKERLAQIESEIPALQQSLEVAQATRRAAEAEDAQALIDSLRQDIVSAEDPVSEAKFAEFKSALEGVFKQVEQRLDLPDGDPRKLEQRASSPLMVLTGTLHALADASNGNVDTATGILSNLSKAKLTDLALPDDVPATGSGVSVAARQAAMALARVPRGMEILQHLVGHDGPPAIQGMRPLAPDVLAVKVLLQAQEALMHTPQDQPALREFRQNALDAARISALADDSARALETQTTVAQRGAFHAFRNGMDSNAKGSDYDEVRKSLLTMGEWVRGLKALAKDAPLLGMNPMKALDRAVAVMEATGGPTLRRVYSDTLRDANAQLYAFATESESAHPASFERAALQALLFEIANQPEGEDLGEMKITPAMIEGAKALASEMGLKPLEQRLSSQTATGDTLRSTSAQSAFEGLMRATAKGGTVGAVAVLEAARQAMSASGEIAAEGRPFSDEEVSNFVERVASGKPRSIGVQGLRKLVEEAIGNPGRTFGQDDLMAGIREGLSKHLKATANPSAPADPTAQTLRNLLNQIRDTPAWERTTGRIVQIVSAHIDGNAEPTNDASPATLLRLRETMSNIAKTAPHVEEAYILRELLDAVAPDDGNADAATAPGTPGLAVPLETLELATYRGLASQQKDDVADAMSDRSFPVIWDAAARGGSADVAGLLSAATSAIESQQANRAAWMRAAGMEPDEASEAVKAFKATTAIASDMAQTIQGGKPTSPEMFVDHVKYTLANMQWRDRLKMGMVDTVGLNTDRWFNIPAQFLAESFGIPLALLQTKAVLGGDIKKEVSLEAFMSSPAGPQIVLGTKRSRAGEAGGGLGLVVGFPLEGPHPTDAGTAVIDGEEVTVSGSTPGPSVGARVAVEARGKREVTMDESVSLRVPRYFGKEGTLHAQFVDLIEDLFRITRDAGTKKDGSTADPFLQLLASQPGVSMGRLTGERTAKSVEASGDAGAAAGIGGGLGGVGAGAGTTIRREKADATTDPQGYFNWPTADSTVTTRVTTRLTTAYATPPMFAQTESTLSQTPAQQEAGEATQGTTTEFTVAAASIGGTTTAQTRIDRFHKRLTEQTYVGGEHFYDLAARGFETKNFKMYADNVMARLSQWAELAAIRAPAGIAQEDRYALGEKFVLDLLAQGTAIAARNTTTSGVSFDILLPELDAQIDHLNRERSFAAKRGDTAALERIDGLLEELFSDPSARKVALMHVSNTTRQAARLGFNNALKYSTTWQGEGKATLAQVPQANPIPDGPHSERRPLARGLPPKVPPQLEPIPEETGSVSGEQQEWPGSSPEIAGRVSGEQQESTGSLSTSTPNSQLVTPDVTPTSSWYGTPEGSLSRSASSASANSQQATPAGPSAASARADSLTLDQLADIRADVPREERETHTRTVREIIVREREFIATFVGDAVTDPAEVLARMFERLQEDLNAFNGIAWHRDEMYADVQTVLTEAQRQTGRDLARAVSVLSELSTPLLNSNVELSRNGETIYGLDARGTVQRMTVDSREGDVGRLIAQAADASALLRRIGGEPPAGDLSTPPSVSTLLEGLIDAGAQRFGEFYTRLQRDPGQMATAAERRDVRDLAQTYRDLRESARLLGRLEAAGASVQLQQLAHASHVATTAVGQVWMQDQMNNAFVEGTASGDRNICWFDSMVQLSLNMRRHPDTDEEAVLNEQVQLLRLASDRLELSQPDQMFDADSGAMHLLAHHLGLQVHTLRHDARDGTLHMDNANIMGSPAGRPVYLYNSDLHFEPLWPKALPASQAEHIEQAEGSASQQPSTTPTGSSLASESEARRAKADNDAKVQAWLDKHPGPPRPGAGNGDHFMRPPASPEVPKVDPRMAKLQQLQKPPRTDKQLATPPKPEGDPELDAVRHPLHRSTFERKVGRAMDYIKGRSHGYSNTFYGKVKEAPGSTFGKPELVKPDDAAHVEARIEEIKARAAELEQRLQDAGDTNSPLLRTKKARNLKQAVLSAIGLKARRPDAVAAGYGHGKAPAKALALAAPYKGSVEDLRSEIARLGDRVNEANKALEQARDAMRNSSYANKSPLRGPEKKAELALQQALAAQQAAMAVYDATDFSERVSAGAQMLTKLAYAERELSRYQAEIAKLLHGGEALPNAAGQQWREDLANLLRPLDTLKARLAVNAGVAGDGPEIQEVDDRTGFAKIDDRAARVDGKVMQLMMALNRGAGGSDAAGAAVLAIAEDVLAHTEGVYLELSGTVKAEAKALRIAAAHEERLSNLLAEEEADAVPLQASLEAARMVRERAQDTLDRLKAVRGDLKRDIDSIREVYHGVAEKAAGSSGKDAGATAQLQGIRKSNLAALEIAKPLGKQEKQAAQAKEASRMETAVSRPRGFAHAEAAAFESLRTELRIASRALSPKRVGTELASSAVLNGFSAALSLATGGDAARAAKAAHALTHNSLAKWLSAVGDDPVAQDVATLHKLMSTMPRGMEVLARLSMEPAALRSGNPLSENRAAISALRVFWSAENAAADTAANADDPKSQAWLAMAKEAARLQLEPMLADRATPAPQLSPRQRAAFNGVRNGYLSLKPGSPYDQANTMLSKLTTQWTKKPDKYTVALDENLSSDQLRAAALAIKDYVGKLSEDQKRPEDAQFVAFAEFAFKKKNMHVGSKLTVEDLGKIQELQALQAGQAPQAEQEAGSPARSFEDPVIREGMTFAEALAGVARLANRVHKQDPDLLNALTAFAPGMGMRMMSSVTKKFGELSDMARNTLTMATNPINPTGMRELNDMSTGLGMNTRDKMAEEQMHKALGEIERAAREAGDPGTAILANGLRRLGGRGAVNGKLSRDYAAALQEKLAAADSTLTARNDVTVHEYATLLLEQLKSAGHIGDDNAELVLDALTSAQRLNLHPQLPTVHTLEDLANVFTQFVAADELRDKRKLFNGNEFGLSLPLNVYALPINPASVGANLRYSYKKEEVLEVGMYINIAEVTTHKIDGGVSAGVGVTSSKANLGILAGGVSHARERQEVQTLSLRLPRKRGDEEKLRAQVPKMMKDLVKFSLQSPQEQEHDDPVALLLAEHEDLAVVVSDSQAARTATTDARANLFNFGQRPDEPTDLTAAATLLGIGASLESAHEWKEERVGAFVTKDFTSSVKATVNADTALRAPVRLTDKSYQIQDSQGEGAGRLRPPGSAIPLIGGFRNFFQRLDKMQISEASSEGAVVDADIDEFYFNPDELHRDLQENREAWLQRGLETIMKRKGDDAVPAHQKETTGRRLAEAELAQFEEAIKGMKTDNKFTQFNINYSLTDDAKAYIGEVRLNEELAKKAGDSKGAATMSREHVNVLKNPLSWTPNKVMARAKAKVPISLGLDVVLKARKTFQVEGQRVPWQYPA